MTSPPNWRKRWEESEDEELSVRIAKGQTCTSIARDMHRTVSAVKGRSETLGLHLSISKRPWRNKAGIPNTAS